MRLSGFKLLAALPLALGMLGTAPHALAHETQAGDLTIIHAWARPNLPKRPTAAYMAIANDGETPDRLLSAASPAFETIELHTVIKQGDVMKMQPVEAVEVPSDDTASLEPGGHHLMLFGAVQAFKDGESFPMTLTFEDAGPVEITVKVLKRGKTSDDEHGAHGASSHSSSEAGHGAHKKHGTD